VVEWGGENYQLWQKKKTLIEILSLGENVKSSRGLEKRVKRRTASVMLEIFKKKGVRIILRGSKGRESGGGGGKKPNKSVGIKATAVVVKREARLFESKRRTCRGSGVGKEGRTYFKREGGGDPLEKRERQI